MDPDPKPAFGIDAPTVVATFVGLTVAAGFVGIFVGSGSGIAAAIPFWVAGLLFASAGAYMVRSSRRGKAQLWDRALDHLDLRGDERALDLGCGRGLVTIEVAKRLPSGHVDGIDIWRNKDQSGNSRAAAQRNVEITGLADHITIHDANMTDLPFDDATFELVTASLAIHNIPLRAERDQAMAEIVRVTKPGGRVVIIDIGRTKEYVAALTAAGATALERSGLQFATYPPARTIVAVLPGEPVS